MVAVATACGGPLLNLWTGILGCIAILLVTACGPEQAAPAPKITPKARKMVAVASAIHSERQTCPDWDPPDDGVDHGLHLDDPLPIPREFSDIVSATRTVMTVQGVAGQPGCVLLDWMTETSDFMLTDDKRFFGFRHSGDDAFGFDLIDRVSGEDIKVGEAPVFSDDRSRMVSVQVSDDSTGDLEGIGIWEIGPGRVAQLGFIPAGKVPAGRFFDVDEWVTNDCVELFSLSTDDAAKLPEGDATAYDRVLSGLPRLHYRVALIDGKWRLEQSSGASPCSSLPAPR
jgi:hypothetical protein